LSVSTADTSEGLAGRVLRGETAAEEALVKRFQRGVMQILLSETPDRELARDLTQETFVIVIERLRAGPLDDPTRLAGYVAQTARNLLIAETRRFVRRKTHLDPDAVDAAADDTSRQEQTREADSAAEVVRKLLTQLKSERDREVMVRFYLDEESKASICTDLRLTDLQFNQVLFRARDRLRHLLSNAGLQQRDLLCFAL
jgi:RNA polymerase sigma-70 factor (ECF subfamily)